MRERAKKRKMMVRMNGKDATIWNVSDADGFSVLINILTSNHSHVICQSCHVVSGLTESLDWADKDSVKYHAEYSLNTYDCRAGTVARVSNVTGQGDMARKAAYDMCVAFLSHLPYSKVGPRNRRGRVDMGHISMLTTNYADILMQQINSAVRRNAND